jgi:hypothetical protein
MTDSPKFIMTTTTAEEARLTYHAGTARDVPGLRMRLLDNWREDGPFTVSVMTHLALCGTTNLSPGFDTLHLSRAVLWWVTPDMVALLRHALKTLPPTTLTRDLVPCDSGLVVFAEPMMGTDAQSGMPLKVDALLWGETLVRHDYVPIELTDGGLTEDGDLPTLGISCYGRIHGDLNHIGFVHQDVWLPLGRSDWVWGTETQAPVPGLDPESVKALSMTEERSWLAALWLLAAHERVAAHSTERSPRPERRRNARAWPSHAALADTEVRLIDVRRPRGAPGPSGGTRDVRWSNRWIVEGHWRQQACGPGWKDHRPVWIEEFVKGPADRPLRLKETVNVLRPAPDEMP